MTARHRNARGWRTGTTVAFLLVLWVLAPARVEPASSPAAPSPTPSATSAVAVPLWAYYYIWFDPSSWHRAKSDTPLLGPYSSDERKVMRRHIDMAKSAGIDGFLVSWKDTPKLTERLARLTSAARDQGFHLGLVYQGLDFSRRPIAISQVCDDLITFADTYADEPVFRLHGDKPVVIWTGTDQFRTGDLERCVAPVRDRLTVLASARTVEQWQRVSPIFDGNAYYWSSVNPQKSWYPGQLASMADAVHATGGLWVAPAAPGFDARLVGGRTVVPRNGSRTLARELDVALGTAPDAIGLISWNEFTENSQVEPSKQYGSEALRALADFTGAGSRVPLLDSSRPAQGVAFGLNGVGAIVVMTVLLAGLLTWSRWRRAPDVKHRRSAEPGP
jgi:hypothetical protein